MLDAKKILDQFLGSGAGSSSSGGGLGSGGLGGAVGGALSKLGGGGATTPSRRGESGGSGDFASQIGGLAKGNMGGIAGGAIAGTLASVLLGGKGGKGAAQLGGGAMKLGGLAILGGLAYKAWQNYQEKQQPVPDPGAQTPAAPVQIAPPPSGTSFTPSNSADEQKLGLLLIRAMIAAARADGKIDKEEIAKIREALKAAGADAGEQDFLLEQLGQPDDLDAIAAEAQGPELASEVWLAARLTIDPDTPGEKYFLQALASKLRLDDGHIAHLEATAAQAKHSGVATA